MTTHHRITTSIVLALALATSAPALATRIDVNAAGSEVPAGSHVASAAADTQASSQSNASSVSCGDVCSSDGYRLPVTTAKVPATAVRATDGFDWGDAGIGAAGGFALSMLGIGTVLAVSQRRTRRNESATA